MGGDRDTDQFRETRREREQCGRTKAKWGEARCKHVETAEARPGESGWEAREDRGSPGPPAPRPRPGTGDGVLGEGLHVDEVVVGTVLLEPLADVLLAPQDHRPRQAPQRWTRVVQAAAVGGWPALQGEGGRCSEG